MPIPPSLLTLASQMDSTREGPFYLYDTAAIRATCRRFRAIPYAPTAIHFATMANANPTFLGLVREEGLRLFVNTRGHLDIALEAGFPPGDAIFTASAMTPGLMEEIHGQGVHVNLDSLGQVERWRSRVPGAPFGVRCNVGATAHAQARRRGAFLGRQSRLGLTVPEIRSLAGSPDLVGLHLYVGTDILDLSYFEDCYRRLAAVIFDRTGAPLFPALEYLDLGGGFGVPQEGEGFDFRGYGLMVTSFMEQVSARLQRPLRLVLEPGRIVGAEAGVFVCHVTDVKLRGNRQLVGVDASSAQFPRPLLYPDAALHPVALLRGGQVLEGDRESTVFGCSTYSRDFLAREVRMPAARVGDTVCIGQAGSYCAAMYTRFLGFPPAPEVFA